MSEKEIYAERRDARKAIELAVNEYKKFSEQLGLCEDDIETDIIDILDDCGIELNR